MNYQLLYATWNKQKSTWLKDSFANLKFGSSPLDKNEIPDIEETGNTCIENATLKVNAIDPKENQIIIGEDSALSIDALDGFPGVKTVRWMPGSDDDRAELILEKMRNIPIEE